MHTLSRRQLLAQASAAAAAGLAGCATMKLTSKSGFIDAHSHVWTPDTSAYPLATGFTKADMKPASFTPDELFKHATPEGVDRVVLIQMSYYRFDNKYMLDMIAQRPDTFRGVAIVDESKADVGHQMKVLAKKGVRGFRIHPGEGQSAHDWINSKGMARLWQAAADENLAVCPLINPDVLPLIDKMCVRFPKTTVVIDHFARVGMAGPIKEHDINNLTRLARHEHTFVKTSAFYALGEKKAPYDDLAPLIQRVHTAFGAKRLMWASDCPFQVDPGHNYHDSITLVRDRLDFLTEEDKAWMLRKTSEKVFFS